MPATIPKETKIKIVARMYFEQNRKQYSSFDQAVKEISELNESFIDSNISIALKRRPGIKFYTDGEGRAYGVANDGLVEFVTPCDEVCIMQLENKISNATAKFPASVEPAPHELAAAMGWKEI